MKNAISALAIAAVLTTTGCAQFFQSISGPSGSAPYCIAYPAICLLAGVAIVGGVIFLMNAGGGAAMHYYPVISDADLKTDITRVHTMDNGLNIYAFRYKGDGRGFVGVLAEELVDDPRFASAVTRGKGGYLQVNYGKLGLPLMEGKQMAAAGVEALARAMAQ